MDQCSGNRRNFLFAFITACLAIMIVFSLLKSRVLLVTSNTENRYPPLDFQDDHDIEFSNTVIVYCGRWEFLQIQLPYLYRDLRSNGGVIDRVQFMMIKYERNTLDRLMKFINTANDMLKSEIFSIHYMGYLPYSPPSKPVHGYHKALYEIIQEVIKNRTKRFIKLDDDVVYIHPKAFANMINMRRSDCAIHYFNIAGCNWRCSWLHQKYGVFKGLNHKKLKFDYSPSAKCGWKGVECANLTLQSFLHHYDQSQLEKYFFDVEYLTDRKRFSINGYLIDKSTNVFEIKKWLRLKKYRSTTEERMLYKYFQHTPYPPCIVGRALIVHFAYSVVAKELLEMGLLQKFHDLVKQSEGSFLMPLELWKVLDNNQ